MFSCVLHWSSSLLVSQCGLHHCSWWCHSCCGAALPSLCQPFVNKLAGGRHIPSQSATSTALVMHSPVTLVSFAKKNEEEGESEAKELPSSSSSSADFVFSVALFMIVLFYVATTACLVTGHFYDNLLANNKPFTSTLVTICGGFGLSLLVFASKVGMSVLVTASGQFIAEITAAFCRLLPSSSFQMHVPCRLPCNLPICTKRCHHRLRWPFLGGLVAMALFYGCITAQPRFLQQASAFLRYYMFVVTLTVDGAGALLGSFRLVSSHRWSSDSSCICSAGNCRGILP